jgi:hypothetical protein
MAKLVFGPGVKSLAGIQLPMQRVLREVEDFMDTVQNDVVITCTTGGVHSVGSYHYYGYAIDFRTSHLEDLDERRAFQEYLIFSLPFWYDVVLHETHLHVEFDVLKAINAGVNIVTGYEEDEL